MCDAVYTSVAQHTDPIAILVKHSDVDKAAPDQNRFFSVRQFGGSGCPGVFISIHSSYHLRYCGLFSA